MYINQWFIYPYFSMYILYRRFITFLIYIISNYKYNLYINVYNRMYLIYIHITSVYVYYLFIIYTHKETKTWNRKRKKKREVSVHTKVALHIHISTWCQLLRCFKALIPSSKCPSSLAAADVQGCVAWWSVRLWETKNKK